MKLATIVFATAQSLEGSTTIGRIFPLAKELEKQGTECFVLALQSPASAARKNIYFVGTLPFRKTEGGKKRLGGLALILNMLATALRTAWALFRLRPDVVIISKPLPANTLGVRLWSWTRPAAKIILDSDDFELTANKLSSIYQRAAIHWSERVAAKLAQAIVVASPFLSDHFRQLTQDTKPIHIIPTGLTRMAGPVAPAPPQNIITYIGSVSVSSGHRVDLLPDILAAVHAAVPQASLLIAGDGDNVSALREMFAAKNLSSSVQWRGRFTPSEVEGLLATTSVIIDPIDDGIANRAKSSYRVQLAATLGLPVVTSNIGIRPELIPAEFQARFFAEPAEANEYADKITYLLAHPLTAEEQERLRRHAAAYTWDKLASRYYEILKV